MQAHFFWFHHNIVVQFQKRKRPSALNARRNQEKEEVNEEEREREDLEDLEDLEDKLV